MLEIISRSFSFSALWIAISLNRSWMLLCSMTICWLTSFLSALLGYLFPNWLVSFFRLWSKPLKIRYHSSLMISNCLFSIVISLYSSRIFRINFDTSLLNASNNSKILFSKYEPPDFYVFKWSKMSLMDLWALLKSLAEINALIGQSLRNMLYSWAFLILNETLMFCWKVNTRLLMIVFLVRRSSTNFTSSKSNWSWILLREYSLFFQKVISIRIESIWKSVLVNVTFLISFVQLFNHLFKDSTSVGSLKYFFIFFLWVCFFI